jgi:hypothetical protein
MSDITLIDDSEQSSLVTNGLAKNGEMYLKKAGSTDAGSIVVYDSGVWKGFPNEAVSYLNQYSVSLDGANDYISIPSSTDFDFGTGPFSFSMWFYLTNVNGYGGLVYRSSGYRVKFQGSDQTIKMELGSFRPIVVQHGSSLLNAWHHLVIVGDRSENKIKGYLDAGTPYQTTMSSSVSLTASGQPLFFGRHLTYYTAGLVDEFSVFNYALSASDIASLRDTSGSNPVPADISSLNPLGWWRMGENDGGTGTTITDQGSGGNDGTLTNGPTFSTDVPS